MLYFVIFYIYYGKIPIFIYAYNNNNSFVLNKNIILHKMWLMQFLIDKILLVFCWKQLLYTYNSMLFMWNFKIFVNFHTNTRARISIFKFHLYTIFYTTLEKTSNNKNEHLLVKFSFEIHQQDRWWLDAVIHEQKYVANWTKQKAMFIINLLKISNYLQQLQQQHYTAKFTKNK